MAQAGFTTQPLPAVSALKVPSGMTAPSTPSGIPSMNPWGTPATPAVPSLTSLPSALNVPTGTATKSTTPAAPITPKPVAPTSYTPGYAKATVTPPTAPVKPAVTLHQNIVTPSGATVNPSTGAEVKNTNGDILAGTQPTVPDVSITGTNDGASTPAVPEAPDPLQTADDAAVKAYADAQNMTPEEIQNEQDKNALEESFKTAYTNTGHQAIPLEFITGQQKNIQESKLNLAAPLEAKAALLQAKRTAAVSASKFALDRADTALTTAKTDKATADKNAEDARRFGLTYGLDEKKTNQSIEDSKNQTALANKKFDEDKREFGLNYALDQQKLAQTAANKTATTATATAQAQTSALNNLSMVNDILKDDGYKAISGVIQTGSIPFTSGSKVKNTYDQLIGSLSLANRQQLKGSGAISDFEAKTLEKAASNLGRNLSEPDMKNALIKVKGVFANAAGLATPVKLTDPTNGKSEVRNLKRNDIEQALKDGLQTEYQ